MIYITLFIILSIFSIFNVIKNNGKNIIFYIFSLILIFMTIFRYGLGTDYFAYKYHFELNPDKIIDSINSNSEMEIGYKILMGFLKSIGFNYDSFIFVIGLLVIMLFLETVYRYSKIKLLSLFIFFSIYYNIYVNSGIRQGIAMSIVFFAYYHFYQNDNKNIFVLLVILSSFFHVSSIIALIVIPVGLLTKKHFKNIIFNAVLIFLSILGYLLNASSLFIKILNLVGISIEYESSSISFLTLIARICFLIFIFFLYKNIEAKTISLFEKEQLYLYFLGTVFFIAISDIQAFSRLLEFFTMFEIIFIPNLIFKLRRSVEKIVYTIFLILLSGIILFKDLDSFTVQQDYYNNGPFEYRYTTVFNKDEISKYKPKSRLQLMSE